MIFACWLFYIIPVILLNIMKEEAPSLRLKALSLICAAFVLYSGIQTANVLYFKKSLEYDACLSLMSETQSKLESLPDYEAGVTPVIILGYPSDVLAPLEGFDRINEITGIGVKNSVISYYHGLYESYFKYVLQKEINLVEADEAVSDKAEAFPSYPKSGYVFELDGAAVVKFK